MSWWDTLKDNGGQYLKFGHLARWELCITAITKSYEHLFSTVMQNNNEYMSLIY